MANEVCTSLGLMGKDLSGKLIQIVEKHGSNASFMISSLMWSASRANTSLCLVALHYPRSHYELVAKNLGFNLKAMIESKTAIVLEPYSMYVESTKDLKQIDMRNEENVKRLFLDLKEALKSLPGKKLLIIDDLSDLLCLGSHVSLVTTLLQYCRNLQDHDKDLALTFSSHCSEENEEQNVLVNVVAHIADFRITIAPLKTGFSANVTGSIDVVDNLDDASSTVANHRLFHFKLSDRQIKVFAPGTVGIKT